MERETAGPDELLRQVARGDEQAFRALYDQLAPRVFGLAKRVVRDPAQAEEVAQEALVEVWRTAARFDAGEGLGHVVGADHHASAGGRPGPRRAGGSRPGASGGRGEHGYPV